MDQSPPVGTSTQKAELIAVTVALNLRKGKRTNVFTDCRYAFVMFHVHGAVG